MQIELIKSDVPRPLANYNECFKVGALGVRRRPGGQRLQDQRAPRGPRGPGRFRSMARTSKDRPGSSSRT